MEAIITAVGIILGLIALVLVLKLIVFLFTNFFTSRLFSIGFSIAALVIAYNIVSNVTEDYSVDLSTFIIPYVVTSVLALSFLVGPVIFDKDKEYIEIEGIGGFVRETGGFIFNLFIFTVCVLLYTVIFASEYIPLFFVLPGLILLSNIIGIIYLRKGF